MKLSTLRKFSKDTWIGNIFTTSLPSNCSRRDCHLSNQNVDKNDCQRSSSRSAFVPALSPVYSSVHFGPICTPLQLTTSSGGFFPPTKSGLSCANFACLSALKFARSNSQNSSSLILDVFLISIILKTMYFLCKLCSSLATCFSSRAKLCC